MANAVLAGTEATSASSIRVARAHIPPLVEPITDRTYVINGSWARTFVFRLDPTRAECIIIDPGISEDVELAYKRRYSEMLRKAIADTGVPHEQIKLELKNNELMVGFLRQIKQILGGMDPDEEFATSKETMHTRVADIERIVRENDWQVLAIFATHHHIDHLGVGNILRLQLGLKEMVLLPDPNILSRAVLRRGDWNYRALDPNGTFQRIDMDRGFVKEFGIEVIDVSGHTSMVAFKLPDGTVIGGDLVTPIRMWNSSIAYLEDVPLHLASLERLRGLRFQRLLLSHGSSFNLDFETAQLLTVKNIERVREASAALDICHGDVVAAAVHYLTIRGNEINEASIQGIMSAADNQTEYAFK